MMEEFGEVLDRTIKGCAQKLVRKLELELFDALQKEKQEILDCMLAGKAMPEHYWEKRHAIFAQLKRARELAA